MPKKPDFLNKTWPGVPGKLSDRITRAEYQDNAVETLRIAFSHSLRFTELVKDLSTFTTEDTLKAQVRDIISEARKAMDGDLSSQQELVKLLKDYPETVVSYLDNPTQINKAYNKIARAAESLNEDALNAAVENALEVKALGNAFRIAQTEMQRAYNMGVFTRGIEDEDTLAFQIDVSGQDNNCEDCLEIAETDNGAGPGIYAIDNVPVIPVHPHCACLITPVYKMDISPEELEEVDLEVTMSDAL